ncbi:hypothetical protein KJ656_17610 [bacterium]|nr:hypothetical protein [bacterium]
MGRNLRLNIDIICLVLFLAFGVRTINTKDRSQNPVEIIDLGILGEFDTRQYINHAPKFQWSLSDTSGNLQMEMIISQLGDSGDSILWRSGTQEYGGNRFHFISLGALLDGNTYLFSIQLVSPDSGWSVEESISFTMNTAPTTPQIGL